MAESDWTEVDGTVEIVEEYVLDSLDLLAEVTHRVRGLLLRRMHQPKTVAELADLLDVPVTRLYHHINRLESHGLISVVATRQSGAATERRYRAVSRTFKLDPSLLSAREGPAGAELGRALGALFDVAKVELQHEIEVGTARQALEDENMVLTLSDLRLTPDRQRELRNRLVDLLHEFDDEDGDPYRLFAAGFPVSR